MAMVNSEKAPGSTGDYCAAPLLQDITGRVWLFLVVQLWTLRNFLD